MRINVKNKIPICSIAIVGATARFNQNAICKPQRLEASESAMELISIGLGFLLIIRAQNTGTIERLLMIKPPMILIIKLIIYSEH